MHKQFCPQLPAFPAAGWLQLTAISHTFQGHLPADPFLTTLSHALLHLVPGNGSRMTKGSLVSWWPTAPW